MGQALSANVGRAINREFQLFLILFPEFMPYYLTKMDKEIAFNAA